MNIPSSKPHLVTVIGYNLEDDTFTIRTAADDILNLPAEQLQLSDLHFEANEPADVIGELVAISQDQFDAAYI